MKTTIDIPESLYKRAKIRAIQDGITLKQMVLNALERQLNSADVREATDHPYWSQRLLRPGYAEALKTGAFARGTDSTAIISEDRSSREKALL
jgi:hypothetical protein